MTWLVPGNLRRKGERTYAHGTDMLQAALHAVESRRGSVSSVKASFHRILKTDPDLVIELDGAPPDATTQDSFASLEGMAGGRPFCVHVLPSLRELGPSYPYDEGLVAKETHLLPRQAVLEGKQVFSSIETLVAMTKLLHHDQVSASHKWVWSRLDLCRPLPPTFERASVRLGSVFGTRLTKSSLYDAEVHLGSIFFSSKEGT